jgi:tetratricopeptide (TPR) repeat protein
VQFVVRRRVARLPGGTQQLLTVASVVGRGFDLEVLAAAARVEAGDALEALAPALDAGLVEHDGAEFRFSHALVADALADEVNAARRAQVHAQVARTIADRSGPELGLDAAVVAHHAIEGLLAGTGDLAVEASKRAARLAAERLADEDAAKHWGDVAAVLARARPGDVAGRVDALVAQAKALLRADRIHGAKEAVLTAIEVAGAAGQVDGMVRAAVLLNHAHVWTNEAYGVVDQRVINALERTLAAMGDGNDAQRADILGALASELVFADRDRHRAACDAAEVAARASGDPLVLARVLIDLVMPQAPADFDRRRALAEEAVALAAANDLPPGVVVAAHHSLAHVLLEAADFDGVAEHAASARRVIEHDPASRFRPQLLWLEGGLLLQRGQHAAALELGEQAFDLHRRARGYDLSTISLALRLSAALDIGGLEELLAALGEEATTTSYLRPVAELGALALLELGMAELAAVAVEPFPPGAPFADDWTTLLSMTAALHVRAELGDVEGAASVLAQLAPYAGRWSPAGTAGSAAGLVDLALARGHALLGDVDAARAAFEAAVAGHERLGATGWLARSLVHQGAFLSTTGDPGDAEAGKAALVRARELAERHGLPYVRRRLDLLGA